MQVKIITCKVYVEVSFTVWLLVRPCEWDINATLALCVKGTTNDTHAIWAIFVLIVKIHNNWFVFGEWIFFRRGVL